MSNSTNISILVASLLLINMGYAAAPNPAHLNTTNVIFGVSLQEGIPQATDNATAMNIALSSGIRYFKFSPTLNSTKVGFFRNMSNQGAKFWGRIDWLSLNESVDSSGCYKNCNWTLSQWNATVSNILIDYPYIHLWEIWGEPQATAYQSGYFTSIANYSEMVKAAYVRIKAHNSSDQVICLGGSNFYLAGGATTYNALNYQWAQKFWSNGTAPYCDAISLHAYTGFQYTLNQTPPHGNQTFAQMLNQSIGLYENLTHKPIYISEFGIFYANGSLPFSRARGTPQKQALFINQTVNLFLSKPYIRGMFYFDLVDASPNAPFGLLNLTDYSKNPGYYTYLSFIPKSSNETAMMPQQSQNYYGYGAAATVLAVAAALLVLRRHRRKRTEAGKIQGTANDE